MAIQQTFTAARGSPVPPAPLTCRGVNSNSRHGLFHKYPSPDSKSAKPIYVPSPDFIAALIVIAGALAITYWLAHS